LCWPVRDSAEGSLGGINGSRFILGNHPSTRFSQNDHLDGHHFLSGA